MRRAPCALSFIFQKLYVVPHSLAEQCYVRASRLAFRYDERDVVKSKEMRRLNGLVALSIFSVADGTSQLRFMQFEYDSEESSVKRSL